MTQITNEQLFETAFYYVVGILSTMEYYEDIPVEDLVQIMLDRASELIDE